MRLLAHALLVAMLALACEGKSGDGAGTASASQGPGTPAPALVGKTLEQLLANAA